MTSLKDKEIILKKGKQLSFNVDKVLYVKDDVAEAVNEFEKTIDKVMRDVEYAIKSKVGSGDLLKEVQSKLYHLKRRKLMYFGNFDEVDEK